MVLLEPFRSVCCVDDEVRRYADRVLAGSKSAHTRREGTRLQPVISTDPAEEFAVRQLEHTVHVFVYTDVDLVDAYPDSRIGARILLEKFGRPVVRRVVGDNKLEIL